MTLFTDIPISCRDIVDDYGKITVDQIYRVFADASS